MDRTASETQHAGISTAKTTDYSYLGLSDQTLTESSGGKIDKSYQYSPWGERLSQVKTTDSGEKEDSYYGYDPHTDVDQITDDKGDTRSTYGYTAYGASDDKDTTGADKPDPADPTKEEYNAYRYNAKRWDAGSGTYDMGFRDYDPGLNRFLTRDSYSGALADMGLSTDPWTMNRYAFAGGNPISNVEIDGHFGWSSITNFVSDHADQITDAAVTGAGLAMMAIGSGGEVLGVALDATGVGAIAGVPINIAAAGLISLGAATTVAGVTALAMDTANYSGGSSSSSSGGDAPKVERMKGSQEGAEDLQERAADLQGKRSWGGGTTSVVKVQNAKTGEVQTWVSTEGKTLPKEWQGLLDEQSGDRFIPGSGHAEQTIVDNLGDDWKIVEGGTSPNVCITHPTGACEGALKGAEPDLVIDGQKYRWRAPGVKTDYRTFWWAG